ncbi:MAG: HIT family protein [Bacilli bacterium]|nr:HIT family protein [Bacilli bacterium]
MTDLKKLSDDEIVALIKEGKVTNRELTDSEICPTCFNKTHDGVLFGDDSEMIVYEDDILECFLVGNPRAKGHVAVSTKKHFKDMMDIDDVTCERVFKFSKKAMNAIREIYNSESVYLCTMCDGPMNHFHVQLIPRYDFEERGSDNFVKPRQKYVEDKEKVLALRKALK